MHIRRWLVLCLALLLSLGGLESALAISSSYDMPYYIEVDLTNQIVTIFNTSDKSIARQMLSSTGMNDATPEGVFYLCKKKYDSERTEWYYFNSYRCYAKYATRIKNGYMFHSIPFNSKSDSAMSKKSAQQFGSPASHGCIRLRVEDAEFIAKECLRGTYVKIYKSKVQDDDLREILYVSSYTGENGMSYSEFLGISEDDLGRGSSGSEVSDLQSRLHALGYYDGEISGTYDTSTVAAVKQLEKDLAMAQNGISSKELLEVIYSEEAPVSTGLITLTEGSTGPIVKKFQSALSALGVYGDEIDSVYDVDVTEAVKLFQGAYNYTADGVASPEVQQAVYYELNRLQETFGEDAAVEPEILNEEVKMATVNAKARVIIRSKANTESEELGKVNNGDNVFLLESGDEWSKVVGGTLTGYMRNKYLEPYSQSNIVLKYTAAGSDQTYQIGHTMEEYMNGAASAASAFSDYFASEQFQSEADGTVPFVTVVTESELVMLNLRSEASSDSEVLAQVSNGTSLRVLSQGDTWTRVTYADQIGYLLNDYLKFWEGTPDSVEAVDPLLTGGIDLSQTQDDTGAASADAAAGDSDAINALVVTDSSGKADVYDAGSEDANVLGQLPVKTQVQVVVVNEEDDWVLISYKGHQGYMKDVNLQFQLSDD